MRWVHIAAGLMSIGLRAIPVLAVIVATIYWLVRISWRPRAVAQQQVMKTA
jgi:hypothetical protein